MKLATDGVLHFEKRQRAKQRNEGPPHELISGQLHSRAKTGC